MLVLMIAALSIPLPSFAQSAVQLQARIDALKTRVARVEAMFGG